VSSPEDEEGWGTTEAIAVIADAAKQRSRKDRIQDAVQQAVGSSVHQQQDITESRLPIRVVIGLVVWAVSQALAVSTLYYQLSGDIRSLQEGQEDRDEYASMTEVQAIRLEINSVKEGVARVEASVQAPPTNLDHLRAIGDLKSDIRLLEQRVAFLEKRL
tara:strand:+ start:285 stop:764 length:480 start_codon:yes stop_codon:yes gene_type:complete